MKIIKDRQTLKGYFKKGCIPTEEQFAELIDSVPNITDDGQAVRTSEGWAFYPQPGNTLRFTLHDKEGAPAAWVLHLTPQKGLVIENAAGETVVELGQDKSISIPDQSPEPSPGSSTTGYLTLAADKEWHDIVSLEKKEFRMYDLFLLLYDPNTGACKTACATVYCLNTVECYIKSPQKHWWGWSGGVKLRWQTHDNQLCLQVRSKRRRTSGKIFCRIR